jgi:hypothetical protein
LGIAQGPRPILAALLVDRDRQPFIADVGQDGVPSSDEAGAKVLNWSERLEFLKFERVDIKGFAEVLEGGVSASGGP